MRSTILVFAATAAAELSQTWSSPNFFNRLPERSFEAVPGGTCKRDKDHKFLNERTERFAVNGSAIPEVDFDVGESYAGSLPIDNSDDTNQLFFWFFPSTNPAAEKEVIIWLTGGPGCSSIGESIQENGPISWRSGTYRPVRNEWSWHHLTNVIWVDQPVGTGFSQGMVTARDTIDVAHQFMGFWKNLVETFDLQDYKIYIVGSSYSGQWSPYVANEMLNANNTNLYDVNGVMVYNGLYSQFELMQDIPFLRHVDRWNRVLGLDDTALAQLRATADECGVTDYIDEYLVFPPAGVQPSELPGPFTEDGGYDPACDGVTAAFAAVREANPCFSLYNVLAHCPRLYDPIGFGEGNFEQYSPGPVYFDRADVKAAIHAPRDVDWRFCSSTPVFVDGVNTLLNPGPGSMPVLPGVIDRTQNVILGQGLLDQIAILEGTLLAIQNLTFGGELGFQSEPSMPLLIPQRNGSYSFGVPGSSGELGTWHHERGLTYFETIGAGHFMGRDAPSVAFRAVEVLLGRISNFGSSDPFTIE